jgi:uncharacterized protein
MLLNQDHNPAAYQISAYQPGKIKINNDWHQHSLIIWPTQLQLNWGPKTFSELQHTDLAAVLTKAVDVVLLGTGAQLHIPSNEMMGYFIQRGIGFEFMDSAAAARTFAVLSAEQRNVVAAILIE